MPLLVKYDSRLRDGVAKGIVQEVTTNIQVRFWMITQPFTYSLKFGDSIPFLYLLHTLTHMRARALTKSQKHWLRKCRAFYARLACHAYMPEQPFVALKVENTALGSTIR